MSWIGTAFMRSDDERKVVGNIILKSAPVKKVFYDVTLCLAWK